MQKLITFAVPCYNSGAYMRRCIDSLLVAGEDAEIVIVNDGSSDNTAEIADEYAAKYPQTVRAVHKPNGGHGSGVNKGLELATGLYYKVVDSDDWVDEKALKRVLSAIRGMKAGEEADLIVCNYVYEYTDGSPSKPICYRHVFPDGKIVRWADTKPFGPSEYS